MKAQLIDLFRKTIRLRSLWLLALAFILIDGAVRLQSSAFPERQVHVVLEGQRVVDADDWVRFRLGKSDEEQWSLLARNMTVRALSGGAYLLTGPQDQLGRHAVGDVLGTWLSAIPIFLLALVLRAALWPAYLRRQLMVLGRDASYGHPLSTGIVRRLVLVRFFSCLLTLLAVLFGILPGLVVLYVGSVLAVTFLSVLGLAMLLGGAAIGYLYPSLAFLFLERDVLLSPCLETPLFRTTRLCLESALRRSRGRLLSRLKWALFAKLLEVMGAVGWFLLIGPLTHSLSRAMADTWLTCRFLEELDESVDNVKSKNAEMHFLRPFSMAKRWKAFAG